MHKNPNIQPNIKTCFCVEPHPAHVQTEEPATLSHSVYASAAEHCRGGRETCRLTPKQCSELTAPGEQHSEGAFKLGWIGLGSPEVCQTPQMHHPHQACHLVRQSYCLVMPMFEFHANAHKSFTLCKSICCFTKAWLCSQKGTAFESTDYLQKCSKVWMKRSFGSFW